MRTSQIKKQLHDYIDTAEDKKLKAIYTLLEDDIAYNGHMTEEQLAEVKRRLADHKNGIGKTYTWEEANAILDETIK